ncbi:hypothetical protein NEOLEDRAFT_417737 [Neolentinus lepideus HHB14362 ss-1]|uniref:Zn(2)-C6 fungal-type domain-containing protein n=1 Tax=Neolentinus lepideus HHB14362 ss-1 TaxID=1314782 RepID=A0A165RZ49_9AGAM|nr:hypothetical protein NEOLEDRAFT_417737 [Neolentinus lepideus HHB14362 ss-1]
MDKMRTPSAQRSPTARTNAATGVVTADGIPIIPLRRRKTQLACNECRRRQVKCEQLPPGSPCSRCKKRGIKCEYLSNRPAPAGDSHNDESRSSHAPHVDQVRSYETQYSPSSPTIQSLPDSQPHWDSSLPAWQRNTEPPPSTASQYPISYYAGPPQSTASFNYNYPATHASGRYQSVTNSYGQDGVHPQTHTGAGYVMEHGGACSPSATQPQSPVAYPNTSYAAHGHGYHVENDRSSDQREAYTSPSPESYQHFQPNPGYVYTPQAVNETVEAVTYAAQGHYYDPTTRQWQN